MERVLGEILVTPYGPVTQTVATLSSVIRNGRFLIILSRTGFRGGLVMMATRAGSGLLRYRASRFAATQTPVRADQQRDNQHDDMDNTHER